MKRTIASSVICCVEIIYRLRSFFEILKRPTPSIIQRVVFSFYSAVNTNRTRFVHVAKAPAALRSLFSAGSTAFFIFSYHAKRWVVGSGREGRAAGKTRGAAFDMGGTTENVRNVRLGPNDLVCRFQLPTWRQPCPYYLKSSWQCKCVSRPMVARN